MYKIYCDEWLMYDDNIGSLRLFKIKINLELNKTGSTNFTIYSNHPYFDKINKLKSIVTVYQDDFLIFRGRVLNDEEGFHKEKTIQCEGELAFLLDGIQRPYEFTGSVDDYFAFLITNYNLQVTEDHQFKVGNVTVTDPNNYIVRADSEYKKTWDIINDKLIKTLGGYLWVRHESDGNYIDYLSDFTVISPQKIEFAKNLIDMKRTTKGENIITALIPLGVKLKNEDEQETGERLTIKSVNNDIDYVFNQEAVDKYGWIYGTQIWDDVTVASNLLTKANVSLANDVNLLNSIEFTAADLATVNKDVSSFHLGTYIQAISAPHSLDQGFLVNKLSIEPLNPAANKLTVGSTFSSFTEKTSDIQSGQNNLVIEIDKTTSGIKDDLIQLEKNTESAIEQSADSIMSSVTENVYMKDETDSLISSVSTSLEQTKDSFEMKFNKFESDLDDVAAGTDAEFTEIRKYIRFIDGKIMLGEVGNELELSIANDRISFLQNNAEVAYFSNNKLYVTDGEFMNSLQLGQFAFLPRANGNLSFKKIK